MSNALLSGMGTLDASELSEEEEWFHHQCAATELQIQLTCLGLSRRNLVCYQNLARQSVKLSKESFVNPISDFDLLIEQAEQLAGNLQARLEIAASRASISQTKQTVRESAGMRRLTLVSCIFLPLNFAASFFGMNTRQLNGGFLSIGDFILFASLTGLAIAFFIVLMPAMESLWAKARRQAGIQRRIMLHEDCYRLSTMTVIVALAHNGLRAFAMGSAAWLDKLLGRAPLKQHPA